ncbi:MAG: uroporphyrinogen-III synthase [Nitrospirota bacterium]|nr:uroporphyrinogen-III synthase [Nitrospirota bacterium]MDE3226875.1 uroporphyrinogen-III synthase [Nitrospirota bacterium]MDE3243415.1 uroporphyrinogen-III synthase [Nitrospirota bacterium]
MSRLISRHGGQPLVAPALREIALEHNQEALAFGKQLLAGACDMLLLLTGVGTHTLIDVLRTRYPSDRIIAALARLVLVARGPKPAAALKTLGLAPTVTVPEPNTWRDVLHALDAGRSLRGLKVAVQEYGVANHELLRGLRERGAEVIRVPVYRWALPENLDPLRTVIQRILAGEVDVLLITNAAQVEHVMQLLAQGGQEQPFRQALTRMVVASIGPTASERLRSHRWPVDLEPSHPKMGLLVKEASEQVGALLAKKRSA